MSRFYVTTPIYYVNAVPHLGTFYTTVVADALARYHRARDGKENVFFLTGLDEHGQKIERIAREKGHGAAGVLRRDRRASSRRPGSASAISNDDFIRTTEPRHKAAVAEMWKRLVRRGRHLRGRVRRHVLRRLRGGEDRGRRRARADGEKLCPIHQRAGRAREGEELLLPALEVRSSSCSTCTRRRRRPCSPSRAATRCARSSQGGLRDLSVSRLRLGRSGASRSRAIRRTRRLRLDRRATNYLTALGGPERSRGGTGKAAFWAGAHH